MNARPSNTAVVIPVSTRLVVMSAHAISDMSCILMGRNARVSISRSASNMLVRKTAWSQKPRVLSGLHFEAFTVVSIYYELFGKYNYRFFYRCLRWGPIQSQRDYNLPLVPGPIPPFQELSLGDCGAPTTQDHSQLYALRSGRE